MNTAISHLVLRGQPYLSAAAARELVKLSYTSQVLPVHSRMTRQWCFANVKAVVKEHGGDIVYGWQVSPCMDGFEMETHAVWRKPDGNLVEVTDGEEGWSFFPSDTLANMAFSIIAVTSRDKARLISEHWQRREVSTRVIPA